LLPFSQSLALLDFFWLRLTIQTIHSKWRTAQTMQVTGKFSAVIDKVKVAGPSALWNGSLAAASATFVGHYP